MLKLIKLKFLFCVVISQLNLTSSLSLLNPPKKYGPRKIERYGHLNVTLNATENEPPLNSTTTSEDDDSTATSRSKRSAPTPATGAEFKKVDLNETSNQLLIHWAGNDVILLLAKDVASFDSKTISASTMYFSYDYGQSFQPKISTNMSYVRSGAALRGKVNQYESIPGDTDYFLMTDSANRIIYITIDAGRSIQTVADLPFHPDKIVLHPLFSRHVIALDQTHPNRDLYLSEDHGFHWRKIQTGVKSAYWGYNPEDKLQTVDESRALYVERHEPGKLITVLKTHDFNQFNPIISNVLEFVLANNTMFVLTTSEYNATYKDLWIAPSRTEAFSKVVFNGYRRDCWQDYIIADSSESQVLVIALGDAYGHTAHLFMSEPNMVDFTLSIENVRRVEETYRPQMRPEPRPYAVYKVEGMRSVFIVNVEKEQNKRTNVVTLITFDKGAIWQQMPTTPTDSHGNPYNSNSSLELYQSQTYELPHFIAFSSSSAPGYVLAEGSVVSGYLSPRPNAVFFSSDGGRIFREIMIGSYHMVWVDHGGAIALISKYQTTNVMWVSVNGGVSWTNVTISDKKLRIYGMLTEPGETSTIITVFGSATNSMVEDFMWSIVQVDVKNLLGKSCEANDYQTWTMSDENGDNCIMGTRDVYQRRIMKNICMNERSYDRPKTSEVCQCRRKDFECDVGYIKMTSRYSRFHPCVTDPRLSPIDQVPPTCKPGTIYSKSNGYRKLGADKCSGGQEEYLSPRALPCPFFEEQSFMVYMSYGGADVRIYNLLTKDDEVWFSSSGLEAFDFDFPTNCVFYTLNNSPTISRRCFDPHLATPSWKVVISTSSINMPMALAFDWLAGNLYWITQDGQLSVSDRDGQAIRKFNFTATAEKSGLIYNATHIVLDPTNQAMYTSHFDAAKQSCDILQQGMDGLGSWKLIFRDSCSSAYHLHSMVLDYESSTLYWVYNHTVKAYTSVDSSRVRVVDIVHGVDISDGVPVAVFKNKLLIGSSGGIWENEKYASDVPSNDFDLQVKNLQHMKVFSKHWQTSPAENPCTGHKCPHLCLLGQNENKTTCMCGNNGGNLMIGFDENNQEVCVCPIGQTVKNGFCTSPNGDACLVSEEFKCMASGRCIQSSKVCDGNNDCPDGSDELSCSFCTEDDFKCNSSMHCIPNMWVCDGESDCDDESDESKCSERNCTTEQFRCRTTGACIAASFHCDGEVDCKDESDEMGCIDVPTPQNACWSAEFQCPSNDSSIPPVCITFERLCDGIRDCPDGTDELAAQCQRDNKTCHEIEFRCANGKCIYDWLYCNGQDNCGDNSDEKNCTDIKPITPAPTPVVDPTGQCPSGHLVCRSSGHCYPLQWACDGVDDCGDSSDEFDCEQSTNHTTGMLVPCYPNFSQFKCSTGGKCIFLHLKCDGDNDCLDWSDEKDCPDFKRADASECVVNSGIGYKGKRNYTKNGFRCQRWDSSTPHDPHYRPLDEHNNYCRNPDNDPTGPWCYTTNPDRRWDYCAIPYCSNTTGAPTDHVPSRNPDTVYCPDGYISCGGNESSNCILSRFACDGESDCGNGSDEEYCQTEVCDVSNGKFKCSNGLCISNHLKCNGFDDCEDNSDELNCPIKCLIGSYRCRHERDKCIEMHRLCDGVDDCGDGSDEDLCGNIDHNERTFKCTTSGKQIDNSRVCDFHLDCNDKSDESVCMCSYGYETYPVSAVDVGSVLIPKSVKRKVEVKCNSKPSSSYLIYLYYAPVEEADKITNFSNAAMMKFTKYPLDNYFTINSLPYNKRYCFALAYRINGVTLPPTVPENGLQQKCFRTQEGVPDVPTKIHFAHEADRRRAVLNWQRPDVTNGKITKYAIKVSTAYGDKILIKDATGVKEERYELERMSFFDTKITVSVAAYTAAGRGQFSKSVKKSLMSRREKSLQSTTSKITRTCVTLDWHPSFTILHPSPLGSPVTGQYLICVKSQWNQTALTSKGNSTTKRICHLAPGEVYSVIVTPVEKGEGVDIVDCADERFHHFSTLSPRVDTPSIDANKSHATGVDSVQLFWSNMTDTLNKTKVVYQIQYGSNVQRSSLHDKFVSGNTVQISKLRHNTHSVFRIRIVQPFVGRWSDFVVMLPVYDHTATPRDLSVTSNQRGGYTATWISPYDDEQLTETYMLVLVNKDSGKTVDSRIVPCNQFPCSHTYSTIRDYALYEVQVNLIKKGGINGTATSINFFTGSEVDPIEGLHLYRDDITSAKLVYHLPVRFEDFYRDHVMDVKVLLCKSGQDHAMDEDCVHEPQLNISSHQITIKDLEFDIRYRIHLKPECQPNVDTCPLESQLSFTFGVSEIRIQPDTARSSKPLARIDIISIAISASVVLVMILCIIAYMMRRRRNRQSANYVGMTSRYNSQSGEAFFVADDAAFNSGSLLDDEVDTPMISGFNDDEPLIVA